MKFRTNFIEFSYIISCLSFNKAYNLFLIRSSYIISSFYKSPKIKGLPYSISIEPTTSCNLKCPQCPSGLRAFTRPVGMLDPNMFYNIIDQIKDTLIYLTFYFQGEPYLHKSFFDMVKYANDHKIYTMTSTNGHYLTQKNCAKTIDSGLNKLIISLDGTTQQTYKEYRIGGSFDKVVAGIETMIMEKTKRKSLFPLIILQFIVFKHNEHEVDQVRSLAQKLRVDQLIIKTAQIYDYNQKKNIIPENTNYSRYTKNTTGEYTIKNKLLNKCWRMWHSTVITWDGTMVPCCFDKDADHNMGSLKQYGFREVWSNESYRKFRASLIKSRKNIEICKNCTEGTT